MFKDKVLMWFWSGKMNIKKKFLDTDFDFSANWKTTAIIL